MQHRSVISYIIILSVVLYQGCDNANNRNIDRPVERIISLSPSITGQLIDLGAEDKIVGVTPYHPPLKKEVPLVGTYITPSIEKIVTLKPDMIFLSEEDGDIQRNSFFEKFGLKYHRFGRNRDFKSICNNYTILAGIIGKSETARSRIGYYESRLKKIKRDGAELRVAFLISVKPLITISKLSHISDVIRNAGGVNVFDELDNPYPILTIESLIMKNPHVVIVMSPGDDVYLYHQLRDFTKVDFINKKNVFVSGDENIPYYSPKEYILSVEKISGILSLVNK